MKLITLVKSFLAEDTVDDALADISATYEKGSVKDYVDALQKYSTDTKVAAVLKAGKTDGAPTDEKFSVSGGSIGVRNLKPTQNEIGAEESLANILTDRYGSLDGFLKGNAKFPDPIITYNSEFVIDGHHRWSQVYAANPDAKIPVLNIQGSLSADQILKAVHTAIVASAGKTVTINANLKAGNLLEFTDQDVAKMVADFLSDNAREVWSANGYDSDDAITRHVQANVKEMLSKSKPPNWAPSRASMPQPEKSDATDFDNIMAVGAANFISPTSGDLKESINMSRWAKIANIKK